MVADEGLDDDAGDWAAEPDEGDPHVRGAEHLDVGCE